METLQERVARHRLALLLLQEGEFAEAPLQLGDATLDPGQGSLGLQPQAGRVRIGRQAGPGQQGRPALRRLPRRGQPGRTVGLCLL